MERNELIWTVFEAEWMQWNKVEGSLCEIITLASLRGHICELGSQPGIWMWLLQRSLLERRVWSECVTPSWWSALLTGEKSRAVLCACVVTAEKANSQELSEAAPPIPANEKCKGKLCCHLVVCLYILKSPTSDLCFIFIITSLLPAVMSLVLTLQRVSLNAKYQWCT